jgi:Tfp pilus assembly protein PilN
MIRINLLAVREAEAARARRAESILVGGALLLTLVGLALAYLSQDRSVRSLDERIAKKENELGEIRAEHKGAERMKQQKKEIEEKTYVVQSLTAPSRRAAPVHILDDLSESAPEFLWLTDFAEVKGAARMNGRAVDNQTIAAFANNLKAKSRYFHGVEIRETAQEEIALTPPTRPGTGQPTAQVSTAPTVSLKKFLIEAAINYQPDAEKELSSTEVRDGQKGQGQPRTVGGTPVQPSGVGKE